MTTRSSKRLGAGLIATMGLVAASTAIIAVAAFAQPAKTEPVQPAKPAAPATESKKDAPASIPATPINPAPGADAPKEEPAMGHAPDGTKMPVLIRTEIPVHIAIIVEDMKIGDGKEATKDSTVTCHYLGTFRDGREFDGSVKRGQPATFALSQVIEGWTMGIPGMKVGGIRKLTIPYQLAYGAAGRSGIPPKSDLIFSIQLLDVK
jgi:FKBP-type peptidyl-prolyl cis-trans isomerase